MWQDNGFGYVSKSLAWGGVINVFCKVVCELWSGSSVCLCDVLVCLPVLWLNAYVFWVGEYECDVVCVHELWLSNGVLWVVEYVCDVMVCVHELQLSNGVVWVGEYACDVVVCIRELRLSNGVVCVGEYTCDVMVFVLELWLTRSVVWDWDVMVLMCLAMLWMLGVVVFVTVTATWWIAGSSLLDILISSGLHGQWRIFQWFFLLFVFPGAFWYIICCNKYSNKGNFKTFIFVRVFQKVLNFSIKRLHGGKLIKSDLKVGKLKT